MAVGPPASQPDGKPAGAEKGQRHRNGVHASQRQTQHQHEVRHTDRRMQVPEETHPGISHGYPSNPEHLPTNRHLDQGQGRRCNSTQ